MSNPGAPCHTVHRAVGPAVCQVRHRRDTSSKIASPPTLVRLHINGTPLFDSRAAAQQQTTYAKKSRKLSSSGMVLSSVLNQGSRLFRSPAVVGAAVSRSGLRSRQHAQHCCQFRGPSGPTLQVAAGIHHRSFWDWRGAGKGSDQGGGQGSAKGAGAGSGNSKGVGGKGNPGGSTSEFLQQEEQIAVFFWKYEVQTAKQQQQ